MAGHRGAPPGNTNARGHGGAHLGHGFEHPQNGISYIHVQHQKQGMSFTTKLALGVGAAAIARNALNESDAKNNPAEHAIGKMNETATGRMINEKIGIDGINNSVGQQIGRAIRGSEGDQLDREVSGAFRRN